MSINVKNTPKNIGKTLGNDGGVEKMSKKCRTMPKTNKEHWGAPETHLTTLRKCWNKVKKMYVWTKKVNFGKKCLRKLILLLETFGRILGMSKDILPSNDV